MLKKTLAIIGNGFDIAHGYKTDYRSFSISTNHSSMLEFKKICHNDNIKTWYDFEKNIEILSKKMFLESMTEEADYPENRQKTKHLNDIFRDLHYLMISYLENETNKSACIRNNVKKFLHQQDTAISFNYTSTAELYTKNVFYIHGSLREKDILLGYDYRDEPCLAQYEDMCWGKNLRREALAFRRFLRKKKNPEIDRLNHSLEIYQGNESSGLGIDTDPKSYIPDFDFLDKFINQYRKNPNLPHLNYSSFTNIIVLGHGLEADRELLNTLLHLCTNLKQVVIFRYDGESDASFCQKAAFFTPYCKNILQESY